MIALLLLSAGCQDATQAYQKVKKFAVAATEEATTPSMPCDADVSTAGPVSCLSGTLTCGQTIEATTVGGDSEWNDDFYAGAFCFPAGDDRSGPERVFLFKAPASQDVDIKLQSDCVDLDIAALAWNYEGTCPGVNHLIPECEGDAKAGGGRLRLNTFKERDYLIAVEGKRGATGTFRLTVDCHPLGGVSN
jgi:hypothetical protein